MPDDSPILSLPYIQPAQAQKHVTHNEALRVLDVIVQLAVQDRTRTEPPTTPQEGDRHIVAAGATGAWAGQAGTIALREHGQWSFIVPLAGWRAQVLAEAALATFDGAAWTSLSDGPMVVGMLGVAATPDPVNRLSVTSAATLLNHAGAGHQLKINKASTSDTASLLFQTAFSGRAEMGLAGADDFAIKVSANGSAFQTGLSIAPATGRVTAPGGVQVANGTAALPGLAFAADPGLGLSRMGGGALGMSAGGAVRVQLSNTAMQVSVPVTGTAVTQNRTDSTAGRLVKVGDFGLGSDAVQVTDFDALSVNGIYSGDSTTSGRPLGAGNWLVIHMARMSGGTGPATQIACSRGSGSPGDLWTRARFDTGVWSAWRMEYDQRNILGSVSESGGQPTGAVIERGANANGEFVRLADGTQICSGNFAYASLSFTTSYAGGFRDISAGNITFAAAFVAAPVVCPQVEFSPSNALWLGANVSTELFLPRFWRAVTGTAAVSGRYVATGRWF